MAAPPSPDPPVLMDVLVGQFLLLLPPEDPADLARAALVSKQWHRVVTGAVFRRMYREFHSSPPLLGYMLNREDSTRFVSISSSFRPAHALRRDLRAVHSSHGRILLHSTEDWEGEDLHLFVWDPILNKEWELPVLLSALGSCISNWDAAVVCAVGDGCSHLDCHFKVVVVGKSGGQTFSCFYSSEIDSWSDRIFVSVDGFCLSKMGSVLIGNTLYFRRGSSGEIFKYDLLTHQMCTISLQCGVQRMGSVLIATEDGRLGVAMTSNSTLCLCLLEQGRLAESRMIQLHDLLPDDALRGPLLPSDALQDKPWVVAFADTGAGGVIFLRTRVGYFTIDLRSGRCKKVATILRPCGIVPYVSFCTPVPGTVSTDEGPAASVVVTTDDEPEAGFAVTGDEVPIDVAVPTDVEAGDVVASREEGPGPNMSGA